MSKEKIDKTLLSTAYFPPITYMALLAVNEKVIIEREESYIKQTFRNRCEIMTANGSLNLTMPVIKTNGNNTKTKDILIFNSDKWYINHWRAIESAYSASPFFLYYQDDIKEFFSGQSENLLDFNTSILERFIKILGISCEINFTDEFIKPYENEFDYRFSITPKSPTDPLVFNEYTQVFSDKFSFSPNLSILDLLFNLGPESKDYLVSVAEKMENYSG